MLYIVEKNKNHIKDLQRIFLEVRQKTFYWLDTQNYSLTDFNQETQGEFVLVAVFNDKVVGFISLWLPGNFIHHFYIATNYQHFKIGTKLLEEAIAIMKSPITLKCLEKNTGAVEFYKKRDFVAIERRFRSRRIYCFYTPKKN
jgi:ribosomal protein S18 acetylase RimI-like enzyme